MFTNAKEPRGAPLHGPDLADRGGPVNTGFAQIPYRGNPRAERRQEGNWEGSSPTSHGFAPEVTV